MPSIKVFTTRPLSGYPPLHKWLRLKTIRRRQPTTSDRSFPPPFAWLFFLKNFLSLLIFDDDFLAEEQHDDVWQKKGPFGENWRTKLEPFDSRRRRNVNNFGRRNRMIDSDGLATADTPEWAELEVFFKLCRGELTQVLISPPF